MGTSSSAPSFRLFALREKQALGVLRSLLRAGLGVERNLFLAGDGGISRELSLKFKLQLILLQTLENWSIWKQECMCMNSAF